MEPGKNIRNDIVFDDGSVLITEPAWDSLNLRSIGYTNTQIIVDNIQNNKYTQNQLVHIVKRYGLDKYIEDPDYRILIKLNDNTNFYNATRQNIFDYNTTINCI